MTDQAMFFGVRIDETDAAKRGRAKQLYEQFVSLLRANRIGVAEEIIEDRESESQIGVIHSVSEDVTK